MALAPGVAALVLASAAVPTAVASTPPKAPACHLSEGDWSWAQRALQAWRMTAKDLTGIGVVPNFKVVLFDAACVAASDDALNVAEAAWTFTPHAGTIELPGREAVPARVTSFTAADDEGAVLVMSTPSVWQAGGVKSELGLETMMVAVLLHEGSHVVHAATYGKRVTALADRNRLPESFNDDSLQGRFKDEEAFASSVQRETDLFHQAATAPDDATARRLAREARDSMRQRAARHYVGPDAYWTEAEDLWLTFEGAGQWAGYQWLMHPRGAGLQRDLAMPGFAQRSRWWSQKQGLALFLALDRIARPTWRSVVFGTGTKTALQMLDEALAEKD